MQHGFTNSFYDRQIDRAVQDARLLSLADHPRLVLFSDCHRGIGTGNVSFLNNKPLCEAALNYYDAQKFTCIELGDGDELWENRRIADIAEIHGDIFAKLADFAADGRLFLLWGNHDRVKSSPRFRPASGTTYSFLPPAAESLILEDPVGGRRLYLLHGHQVDPLNNQLWLAARWRVRYLWKPLELAGIKDPTSAAKNYKRRNAVGARLEHWARSRRTYLTAGHTHRPTLTLSEGEGWGYFNTGSCVHPNTITCIELVYGQLRLIKWTLCADENSYLKVCRSTIAGPKSIF